MFIRLPNETSKSDGVLTQEHFFYSPKAQQKYPLRSKLVSKQLGKKMLLLSVMMIDKSHPDFSNVTLMNDDDHLTLTHNFHSYRTHGLDIKSKPI